MPKLIIQSLGNRAVACVPVESPVLRHIQAERIDWMHACGGKGRCTTCKMLVMAGSENLSELTPAEVKYRELGLLKSNERLTCQCRILAGEVVARVPRAYQFPHLTYSE